MRSVKWGLIGCGDISTKRVAPALVSLGNSQLVAVVRAQYVKAESFAKRFAASRWYKNWQELVVDDELDAIYISTPVHLHAEQTIAAAEAGKHVLCEKPMAMTAAECDKMIAACHANRVKLGVAYYRHFYPAVARIKEILRNGEIGLPVYALVRNHESFNPGPAHPRYWLMQEHLSGGGPMMDMGCHRIEVLTHILGPVVETKATLTNAAFERDVEDTAIAHFTFMNGSSGVIVSTHAAKEPQDTLEIWGCKGTIRVSSLNGGNICVSAAFGEREEVVPPHDNLHLPLIEDFANAVLEDREPAVTGQIGRMVNSILDEIYGR